MSTLRMTERQYSLLANPNAKPKGKGAPRIQKPRSELPENILTGQVTDFLRAHGWTVTRQQSGLFTRPGAERNDAKALIRIGEKGVADWRAERPFTARLLTRRASLHELFYMELKAPGKKPRPEQLLWLERRRLTGTTAEWFDSFDDDGFNDGHAFLPWYKERFT